MACTFEEAFAYLMQSEDPGMTGKVTLDSGGLTRWGISQRAYPTLDIRNLTLEQAAAICRRDYWTPIRGYQLAEQRIGSKLLDMAFNMGVKTAVMILQSALNTHCQPRADLLTEDGKIGPRTLQATNAAEVDLLLIGLCDVSKQRYEDDARRKPSEAVDLKGWLARAAKIPPVSTAVTA
jgi:lysozyme family protein